MNTARYIAIVVVICIATFALGAITAREACAHDGHQQQLQKTPGQLFMEGWLNYDRDPYKKWRSDQEEREMRRQMEDSLRHWELRDRYRYDTIDY